MELRVLGLLGKMLTGPKMKKFYISDKKELHHMEGIEVLERLKVAAESLGELLTTEVVRQVLERLKVAGESLG